MSGIQTANYLLDPKVKREIDRLHYQIALLRKELNDAKARLDVLEGES